MPSVTIALCNYKFVNDFTNLIKDLVRALPGVDHLHPMGSYIILGNNKVSFSHPLVKLNLFFFKTPFFFLLQCPIPFKRSLNPKSDVTIEEEGDIRLDPMRGKLIEGVQSIFKSILRSITLIVKWWHQ